MLLSSSPPWRCSFPCGPFAALLWLCVVGTIAERDASAGEVHLRGRVVDQAGRPVDGALVRLLGADLTAVTGSDGRWVIDEGRPTSVFPERMASTSSIGWKGPGEPLEIGVRAPTWVTVLGYDTAGRQIGRHHLYCRGHASHPYPMPAGTALVSICSQACDRVVYQVNGTRALQAFSTCPDAPLGPPMGTIDFLSIDRPGQVSVRLPLSSHRDAAEGERLTVLARSATVVPADPTTLAAVRARLAGGEIVELADGQYGVFEQKTATGYSDWVTFRPAAGAKAVFSRIVVANNSSNSDGDFDVRVCFQGLTVTDGVALRGARFVEVRDSSIQCAGEVVGSMVNIQKAAVSIRQCRGIRIEGCDITHAGIGINGTGNHLIYRKNRIHHCSQDGMHYLGGHDFLCEYNEVFNVDDGIDDSEARQKPWNMHCDCIQMYPIYGSDEPSNWLADCTLRGNRFHQTESMAWMIQSKRQDQLKRFLIENNITTAVPGYLFHFKDSCAGVVFRFNTFLLPPDGIRFTGLTGREFDTRRRGAYQFVALPSGAGQTTFVEIYGNLMGGRNEFDGAKLRRCDNNLYYGGGGRMGVGERSHSQPPFVDVTSLDAIPSGPAVAVPLVSPDQPTDRHRVPLPVYDANGNRRAATTCLGAVDINAQHPDSETGLALAKVKKTKTRVTGTPAGTPGSAGAGRKAVTVSAEARSRWDGRLQAAIRTAHAQKAWPGFSSRLTRGAVTVEALAEDGSLTIRLKPTGSMVVAWSSLTVDELADLSESLTRNQERETRLIAGFFCLLAGRPQLAERYLDSLGAPAEAVRAEITGGEHGSH